MLSIHVLPRLPIRVREAQKFTPCSSIAQRLHSIGSTVETFVRVLLLRTTSTPFETRLFCLAVSQMTAGRSIIIHHVKDVHAKMIKKHSATVMDWWMIGGHCKSREQRLR